ncbi:glycosyltransferase family 4 protein [Rossellomorea sp. BNER]|uniref:glycosyltransferase family 4 protein n=1 Tax=Rossellomorea sp. BNER TaxID=2962031 RepID=UPI003AF1E5D5|nr:glycosyltransferase family 4 protein [Rossellomorea sp. BNER]
MRIIYVSQHFPPEIGAAQGRAFDMSSNLMELGHDLHILTSFPNNIKSNKFFEKKKTNKLNIYRSISIKDTKSSSIRRLANYISFAISSFISGLRVRKPDIVYATSPQLFQGLTGYFLSKIHRTKFVFEVRDLWVDFAEILGQFQNKRLLNLARKLERFLYKKADHIVVVTNGYKDKLISLGIPETKISVIYNGVNPSDIKSPTRKIDIKEQYNIPKDSFLVLYAGNIGAAQGLKTVVNAARKVNQIDSSIFFLFIGEGVEKDALVKQANDFNLTNILFIDSLPKKELESFYYETDVGIVSLKKQPLFEITIPSKLFDYMAMGVPTLVGVDGETREIVEKNNAGLFFEPENDEDFIRALLEAKNNQNALSHMKKSMQYHLSDNFNRKKLAKKLNKSLLNLKSMT